MKRWLLMVSVGLWIICAPFIFVNKVEAFEVSPAISDVSMMAGSSTQREISVKNTDSQTQTYFLTIQKFVSGGGGHPAFLDPSDTVGLPSWIRVTDPQFTLQPGEEKNIKIVIDVPADAPSGGAYAAIFVTEKPQQTTPVGISKRITSLFLVAVNRDAAPANIVIKKIEQEYKDVGGWKRWFIPRGNGSIDISLQNDGDSHGMSIVELRVSTWGMMGKKTRDFSQVIRLLPKEGRKIVFSWNDLSFFEGILLDVRVNGAAQPSEALGIYVLRSAWVYLAVILIGGGIVWFWRKRQ